VNAHVVQNTHGKVAQKGGDDGGGQEVKRNTLLGNDDFLYQGEQGDQEKDKVDKREHIKVQAKVLTQWPEDAKWVEKGGTLDGYANRNIRSSSHFDYKKGVDIFQRDRIFFKGTGKFCKEPMFEQYVGLF
jgi:hypothetical protein